MKLHVLPNEIITSFHNIKVPIYGNQYKKKERIYDIFSLLRHNLTLHNTTCETLLQIRSKIHVPYKL